jgi:subtilisin family serine protease
MIIQSASHYHFLPSTSPPSSRHVCELRLIQNCSFVPGEKEEDLNGHGSHVAGIFGSKTYGAAKRAKIFMIKVLDEAGSASSLLWYTNGVDRILGTYEAQRKNCPKGMVVSISIRAVVDPVDPSQSENNILSVSTQRLIDRGLPVFIAAGNDNTDARAASPANLVDACTIGNTDRNDNVFRGFEEGRGASNFGSRVDLFAPGTDITSTWNNNEYASNFTVSRLIFLSLD